MRAAWILCIALVSTPALSQDSYDLFHPVPKEKMRELQADRPDVTETPFTVDAGHFQLETGFFNYTRIGNDQESSEMWDAIPFFLRVGLTERNELQIGWGPYSRKTSGAQTFSGIGDVSLRFKQNLVNQDSGAFALTLLPSIKAPTSANGIGNPNWETGLLFPMTVKLPSEFQLDMMPQIDLIKSEGQASYHTEFLTAFSLGHPIVQHLDGFVEFFNRASNEPTSPWQSSLQLGLKLAVGTDLQLDVGSAFGLNRASPRLQSYAGLVLRR